MGDHSIPKGQPWIECRLKHLLNNSERLCQLHVITIFTGSSDDGDDDDDEYDNFYDDAITQKTRRPRQRQLSDNIVSCGLAVNVSGLGPYKVSDKESRVMGT